MTVELTPADIVLIRYALDDAIRAARQAHSIYGTDTRDQVVELKALRLRLCGV